ncbi:cadherin repeat domain-containing protein, partial [Oceanobacter sp. 4_MG-2023]|uniref:beta strand repeat-containing protein n=1 Tax=Oceanobacter sp. 4_MG-2023 TaxID=3062623 RepID=UPI002733A7B7
IDENSGASSVIYTAATDDATAVYSLSGTDASLFSINSATGEVTLLADADYESKSSYNFTVIATDGAGNHTDQTVTLAVNNLDEAAPSITSGAIATAIDENSGAGSVIYTATADDSADISDGVTFSLSGDDAAYFSIDASTGEVTLLADADYETKSSYNFTVIASDGAGHFTDQTVTLAVNNLDEVGPVFTSGTLADAIDENSGASSVIYTAATDDATAVYSLSGTDASLFSINSATGEVTLLADADYETKSSYSFTVTATDGAGNHTDQTVTLAVNNLDEAAPSITSGATATSIDENSGAGQVVYTAVADDSADISDGVTFSLSGTDAAYFTIDTNTGEVTLKADADYETKSSYSFTVTATDGAGHFTDQIVTLAVNDLDESGPVFNSGTLADAIDENSGASSVIYTAATDDATAVYSLSGTDASLFSINSATGEVTLLADADYESKSSYNFTVIATDGAGNHTDQIVTLAVNNLDEVAPTITSGATATAIDENSGAGSVIYTATADDSADISDGVTFSLSGDDAAYFSINSATGEVTLLADADYETKSSYSFVVTATDGAGNFTNQTVTLAVNDLDDTAPDVSIVLAPAQVQLGYATVQDYFPQITEVGSDGAYAVTWLGRDSDWDYSIFVQAFSADGSLNGTIVPLTAPNHYDYGPQITAVGSGGAYVVTWYGADSANDYSIFVQAFNADGSLNGTAVQLEALGNTTGHDFDPQITAVGSDGAYVVTWNGADSANDYSIFVQAFKADGSFNGDTVQLEAPGNTTYPQITAVGTDGAYVVTWYGDDSDGDYSIFVQAFKADGSFNGDTVQLEVPGNTTADDWYPQITAVGTDGAYVVTWYGADSGGDDSIFVQAFDADGSLSGTTVQLEALGNNAGHDLLPQITSVGSDGAYVVTWYGYDGVGYGGNTSIFIQAFNAEGSLDGSTVQLEALGNTTGEDYAPQITAVGSDGAYVVTWYGEDSNNDYSVFVQAFNADGSFNGATVQLEALGNTTGDDYDPQITAVGSDGAYVVTWYGENSDGNNSIFMQAFNADGSLVEDSTYETGELVTLQSSEAGTVYLVSDTVTVTSESDITSASSHLWVAATLAAAGTVTVDTTALAYGDYYAYAVDNAGNLSLVSDERVTLADQTAPTFTSDATIPAIDENSGENVVIYTATTDDAAAVYSLSGTDASLFSINSATGEVTLLADADYETKPSYSFTVTATDGAGNHTDQIVTLAVNNLDEVAPTITSGATATAIDENSGAGQVVYTATADDSADISDGV